MKKALLIYSLLSGRSHPQKKINKINKALKNEYIINSFMCSDDIQLFSLVSNAKKDGYAFIIFLGGDGSFHHLINALMKINKEVRLPVLLVNNGTLNDFAHGIGIRNIKSSIKALRQNKIKELDVISVNDKTYCAFCFAAGKYVDIPYSVSKKEKRKISFFSYYFKAIKEVFKKEKHHYQIDINGESKDVIAPFIMVLNNKRIGGFLIDKNNLIDDNKFSLFVTGKGIFNGLLNYFIFKSKNTKYVADYANIRFDHPTNVILDGEKYNFSDVKLTLLNNQIKIFVK